jgi:hypothetical protein
MLMRIKYVLPAVLTIAVLLSCQTGLRKAGRQAQESESASKKTPCDQSLKVLVDNSTFNSPFKSNITPQVEQAEDDQLKIQLTTKGENNIDQTIGWLTIDLRKQYMCDITNDIEGPVALKFNKRDWDRFKACYAQGK